ncbi:MAG: glycosyltransferase, partial [Candidatus Tectomicrobia bacterium]|nr:glycosyltransferase [Candidatus Tectomicrobia bacterium]
QAILQLRRYLVTHCIDVLHTHGFKSDIIGALAAWGLPVRLVSTLHGWSADEGWLIRAYEAIGRLFLRRFDRLYPLSPALLRTLQRLNFPASKLRLVLNAVDETAFEASWQQRQTRQAHEPLTILFVGRLCRPKGIFDLLHAFHRSRFDVPALLQVVGEGPERAEIEALCERLDIASRVRFVGFVDDVRPLYDSSDVLVLPSYSEGIPRVVMEAFAAGLPVIGTAIPGIQQLVTHEGTGLLAPLGDEAGLAQALERMAAAPEWARDMALQARHLIETTHAASRQAQEFEAEYIELAREVRATR